MTSTWIEDIDNGPFQSWTGLTPNQVRKNLTNPVPTVKGNLNQAKNVRSIKFPITMEPSNA